MDFKMLQHDYATIAAAALTVANQMLRLSYNLDGLKSLAPFLCEQSVNNCVSGLGALVQNRPSV